MTLRKAIWIRLVLIGILLLQIPILQIPLARTSFHGKEIPVQALPTPDVPLDTQVTVILNNTHDTLLFNVPISDPGLYNYTMVMLVDNADPMMGVDLYLRLYESVNEYVPQLDAYLPKDREFDSGQWWSFLPGWSSLYWTEFMVVQPGSAVIEFDLTWYTPWDQVSVNFTVSQQYSFADAPSAPLGQDTTIRWTEEDAWNVTTFTAPSNALYNISLSGNVPYSTTAGWPGNPIFLMFDVLALFDLIYGSRMSYSEWMPTCNIPAGPAAGVATWTAMQTIPLPAGDYYLVARSLPFLFLNGTYIDLTLYVEPVSTLALGADESLPLYFDAAAPVNEAYVAVTVPSNYMVDFYLSNPEGGNWTVATYDAWHGMPVPPSYDYYEDPTTNITIETRYNYGVALYQPVMMVNPGSGLLGEQYFEPFVFLGTEIAYLDDVPQLANFPAFGGPICFWNTFYLYLEATPGFIGPPSTTFNISLNLDTTPIPQLTTTSMILPINQTIAPFYHGFLLPVESGVTYEISATPTYTSNGVVMLQGMSAQGEFYKDWGLGEYWPLFKAVGMAGMMAPGVIASYGLNDTISVRFTAVRDTTMLIVVLGTQPMLGPSDTTELSVSLTITQPTDYTLGSDYAVTTTSTEYDFTSFNVPLIAGYRYQVSLSIDHGSIFALGYFFDDEGQTPFGALTHDPWPYVQHTFSMSFTGTYTARHTGVVTFALVHQGNARFSITLVDDTPPDVEILEPDWGASFEPGDIIINFTASDEIGLASLVVGIDGSEENLPLDSTSYTYAATTSGLHHIYIEAEDTQGNIAIDSITILVLPEPTSWTLGQNAAYGLLYPMLIMGAAATGIICFLLGWFIKGRRKP
ncbi:MAG: hypothetical protein Q6364_02535 [Candidatus Hermodarchaeota archaeon]|nr:hypothetical protein [Candidatus Hermodarchaeota archaeon]